MGETRVIVDTPQAFTFGETGMDLIQATGEIIDVTGFYTGYLYRFTVRPKMYVDRRDTPYLLRPGLEIIDNAH